MNQVFVNVIIYFETKGEFYYISLIMDLFNMEIAGYPASDNFADRKYQIAGLRQRDLQTGQREHKVAIINSDGEGQYDSKEFHLLMGKVRMLNSLTEESVCENVHAERLKGNIKNNYLYPYGPTKLNKQHNEKKSLIWSMLFRH
jgi:putative transposase